MTPQCSIPVTATATMLAVATFLATTVQADMAAVKAVSKCAEDNGVKLETLMKGCDPTVDISVVPGFKCFNKCLQQYMGIMDDTGNFMPEKAGGLLAEEYRTSAIDLARECAKEANAVTDLCERSFHANDCMRKKDPEMYKKSCEATMAKLMAS